ncbi:MAG: hypothetical protein J5842_05185 [Lachnospiraceae bacterium]|nr:hypothetical protein [Lachnospiraceae bacterium]
MSINISPRTDYSSLFSSMSTQTRKNGIDNSWAFGGSSSSAGGVNLSDYASIKNGSYGKLLKAYYAKDSGSSSKTSEAAKKIVGNSYDSTALNSDLSKKTAALSKSADALLKKGDDSVFAEKELTVKDENGVETKTKGYDRDAIYKAVDSFAKDYNSLLDSAAESNNKSVLSTAANMTSQTSVYKKALEKVGIKVGDDNKLTIDKEAFEKADVEDIKNLFGKDGSLADSVKNRSDMIAGSARDDSLKTSGTYGSTGLYENALLNGTSFSSFI